MDLYLETTNEMRNFLHDFSINISRNKFLEWWFENFKKFFTTR
jgi:hypothetical protein